MHCSLIVLTLILYGGLCFSVQLPSKVMLRFPASRNNVPQQIVCSYRELIEEILGFYKWCALMTKKGITFDMQIKISVAIKLYYQKKYTNKCRGKFVIFSIIRKQELKYMYLHSFVHVSSQQLASELFIAVLHEFLPTLSSKLFIVD